MKGIIEMKISKEKRQFLKKELREYQQHIRRSLSQIRGLRQWSDWFMN